MDKILKKAAAVVAALEVLEVMELEVLEEVLEEVPEEIIGGGNRGGSKGGAGGGAGHSRPEKRSARRENHARTAATRGTMSPNATPVHPGESWQNCFCGHCRAK